MSTIASFWWVLVNLAAIFRVLWKAQCGRFFYFRDEAQDFVEFWAEAPDDGDELFIRMKKEAIDELKRRERREVKTSCREFYDQEQFRVWPDGTVQCLDDGEEPYSWMSDDFVLVWAYNEEDAARKAQA